MELTGKIYQINETQNVTDTFSKREFIIETEEQYKQYIVLQLVKDKCSILDSYKKGDNVKASINLKGRLWTNPEGIEKCFNTIECWRIEKLEDLQTENNIEVIQPEVIKQNNTIPETEDEVPF